MTANTPGPDAKPDIARKKIHERNTFNFHMLAIGWDLLRKSAQHPHSPSQALKIVKD